MMRLHAPKSKMELSLWIRMKILSHLNEYLGDLYNDNRGEMPVITPKPESRIIYREVEYALKAMPMKKYPGDTYIKFLPGQNKTISY